MVLQDFINEFNKYQDEILGEFRKGLKKKRGSYDFSHNASGQTSRNLEMTNGTITKDSLVWDINSDGGFFLQTGGIPKINFGSESKKPNAYIAAIEKWLGDKYKIYGQAAKRKAFAIAMAAHERADVVKHPGWVDDIRKEVVNKSNYYISRACKSTMDISLSKLPKEVTTIKNI
tara:strand:- start:2583 stop:3104 length:522 start_codon:yes stop_codon:yes gene_type:complete